MKKTSKKTARASSKRKTVAKAPKKLGFFGSIWKKIRSL